MDRSRTSYTVLHYVLLITVIFACVAALEAAGISVPLWAGVLLAIVIGLLYPRVVRSLDIAPTQWER